MFTNKSLEKFSVSSQWLRQSDELRLDASYYNPRVAHAVETLKKSGIPLKTLGEVTSSIFIPPRFARTYVSKEHGLPFLQGSHVVHFQPADLKYVSSAVHKTINKWLIRENWILVTRSGTVGRVAITPKSWEGWAASEHILRIIPDPINGCSAGYIYAYLSSSLGQAQLTSQIYGAVVDELTEAQTRAVLIPVPKTEEHIDIMNSITDLAMKSVSKRAEAVSIAEKAIEDINSLVPPIEEPDSNLNSDEKRLNIPYNDFDNELEAV